MEKNFIDPENLADAFTFLSQYGDVTKCIAGGQSLVPILKEKLLSPEYLLNLKELSELARITENEAFIKIGALTTHRTVETSPLINKKLPVLAEMEKTVGTVQIRNWGTIGGDLCHADPACDPAVPLICLKAQIKAGSLRGEREISLEDFFLDLYETKLEPDEILTEIKVPVIPPNSGAAFLKESMRYGDHAILSAGAFITLEDQIIKTARIVLGGVDQIPVRIPEAEKVLLGNKCNETILKSVGAAINDSINPTLSIGLSEDYKRELAGLLTKKVIASAINQAFDPDEKQQ